MAETVEDAARSDRLSGLQQIIRAIRPLVFNVKSNDKYDRFRDAFEEMYEMVKGDKQITAKLVGFLIKLREEKQKQKLVILFSMCHLESPILNRLQMILNRF